MALHQPCASFAPLLPAQPRHRLAPARRRYSRQTTRVLQPNNNPRKLTKEPRHLKNVHCIMKCRIRQGPLGSVANLPQLGCGRALLIFCRQASPKCHRRKSPHTSPRLLRRSASLRQSPRKQCVSECKRMKRFSATTKMKLASNVVGGRSVHTTANAPCFAAASCRSARQPNTSSHARITTPRWRLYSRNLLRMYADDSVSLW